MSVRERAQEIEQSVVEQYLVVDGIILKGRELEIIRHLATDGPTNAEIGRRLYISYKTVKVHIASLMAKTGINTRAGLVCWFLKANTNEQLEFDWGEDR